ncbi:MAG: DUF3098 domain-containing protein [Terrimonas sp.]|nr:DUF3098 domain-containing protein [Terrimonas sp.]
MSQKKKISGLPALFNRENYIMMLVGVAVMVIGLFLMKGGKSDPSQFNPKEVYSTTRTTIAPILILIGLAIEVLAIFRKPKTEQ